MECYKFDQQILSGRCDEGGSLFLGGVLARRKSRLPFIVAGVDEAGRGPLAGPVVVAAVILPAFPRIPGLNDSKRLSEAQRENVFPLIKKTALAVSLSIISAPRIDEMNIFNATMAAMRSAIEGLKLKPDLVLIDGDQKPHGPCPEVAIVKGDGKSAAIMAASIVAKVTRDRIMMEFHAQYPGYGFHVHKGYGVPAHIEALKKLGPSPCHRKSFEPVKGMVKAVRTEAELLFE